jgi:hypothetical protein
MVLLVSHDYVDVVCRVEAVGHGAQEVVGVGGEVNADDRGRFIHDNIQEARVLMCEPIVTYGIVSWLATFVSIRVQLGLTLTPDCTGKKDVERGYGPSL